jgi:hypothetical protein
MGKYQLIAPYQSDKIYENSNINKCAKKFHNMLKQNNNNCQYFTLKNIEDNTYYKFRNKHFFQRGGGDEHKQDNVEKQENNDNVVIKEKSNDIEIIEKINKLESRIDNLENKIKELKEEVRMNKEIKEEIKINKETKEDDNKEEVKEDKESKDDKKKDNEENESDKVSEGGTKIRGLIPPPKDEDICVIQ